MATFNTISGGRAFQFAAMAFGRRRLQLFWTGVQPDKSWI
jgi:hypothetical protein